MSQTPPTKALIIVFDQQLIETLGITINAFIKLFFIPPPVSHNFVKFPNWK